MITISPVFNRMWSHSIVNDLALTKSYQNLWAETASDTWLFEQPVFRRFQSGVRIIRTNTGLQNFGLQTCLIWKLLIHS